ncbi:hypothetical protein [Aureibacter tunicatorum]|uniref:MACPF domain-containing protein n=1 Tax=Aureibacter tunicatorum TaxID=866807 RepID=A0AAE4BU22_9BACT|nr:hypothetical protein [Aureibacter tunicatorum]MDR6240267.1 hypothetical protein [Aureibacter tunicatorum]BDD05852.1 hypothetical protein AUTU_33350 [Aureibacter tunicatorum]
MEKLHSCNSQEPFTKLDENGKASILNYNLPQSTTYDATSFLGIEIDPKHFKENQRKEPINDYWDLVLKTPKEDLLKRLDLNIPLTPKIPLIQTNDEVKTAVIEKKLAEKTQPFDLKLKKPSTNAVSANAFKVEDNNFIADRILDGYMPVMRQRFSRIPEILYIPKPAKANPRISIVLHLKMSSYLGDYGAGRTLRTFSLLPGEKTTISIRSYQYQESIKKLAQNVLDSYSESSAEDLQSMIENDVEFATNLSRSETVATTGNWKAGGSLGLDLGFFKIGGGGGGGGTNATTTTVNEAIQSQVGILVNNTSRHTSKADTLREVEVNTSTQSTNISENEKSIVRELENINKSRVLNFVFRQLLQEFISITYIDDVSFTYSTGFPSQRKSCKLSGLKDMLNEVMADEKSANTVLNQIYTQLSSISDHEGTQHSLIEKVSQKLNNSINPGEGDQNVEYVRVKKDINHEYRGKFVNGIIVNTTHRILRTPSVVVDALLGQGEALDCYNMKLQNEATVNAALNNQKIEQAIKVIDGIEDSADRAKLYKKVFGDCCEAPCECEEN